MNYHHAPIDDLVSYLDTLETVGPGSRQAASQHRLMRRHIRYRLFRIREAMCGNPRKDWECFDQGLAGYIQSQFTDGLAWRDFTVTWDVAVDDPLELVESWREYVDSGGAVKTHQGSIHAFRPELARQFNGAGALRDGGYYLIDDRPGRRPRLLAEMAILGERATTVRAITARVDEIPFTGSDPPAFTHDRQGV